MSIVILEFKLDFDHNVIYGKLKEINIYFN